MKTKLIIAGVFILAFMLIAPFTVAAATNTEILAIMNDVIKGILQAGEQAYCAAGIQNLC